jgi:energy-coupling factor transporter ATP-binding protein EcfA2
MSDATQRVLDRLARLEFETRLGTVSPFGEALPLVTGVAWDSKTAQIAFVAEIDVEDDIGAWRQLLFAGSGLRHHLSGDSAAAFGTPVVLAIVDGEGERRLRDLSEDLAQRYAVFSRVDLSLVRRDDLDDDDDLDLALAPLLPCCRSMLGQEISKAEVQRFWDALRNEIELTAHRLDDMFAPYRETAGRDSAKALIGESANAPELPAPIPVGSLGLQNFRSFASAAIDLAPVSVIHGANGSGKTSLVEGLELIWAHRSQRQPTDVDARDYERHLPRDGSGEFLISSKEKRINSVEAKPRAELQRCVLSQDAVAGLVGSSPADRYAELLAITGLEIPDLKTRTADLLDQAKREADDVLVAAGLPRLPRRDSDGRKHLVTALSSSFARQLPSNLDLLGLEQTLADASGGTFVCRDWSDAEVAAKLEHADTLVSAALSRPDDLDDVVIALDDARDAVRRLAAHRRSAALAARLLLEALVGPAQLVPAERVDPQPKTRRAATGIPRGLAVRWLSHSRGLLDAAGRFRADARDLDDKWARQLTAYADALQVAAEMTPQAALEPLTRPTPTQRPSLDAPARVTTELYSNADFTTAPADVDRIQAPLRELIHELQRHPAELEELSAQIDQHPARRLGEYAQPLLRALCRFEIARNLRREGPVMRASEDLVHELLQGRLAPVLRELVAAIVRFEWYFKPLQVSEADRKLVLGGLATPRADLDARLLLNAAERHVVGIAWFLALHLLQPEDRRRILVLDDPTSGFDAVNQAGYVTTLRAFARLTRPDQIIMVTQDDGLAAILAEEFAPVDDWPTASKRVRCLRDADDGSKTVVEWSQAIPLITADESVALGLDETTVSS